MSVAVDAEYILNTETFLRLDTPEVSYSPLFSNFGLTAAADFEGVDGLYLHYNRATLEVFTGFLKGRGLKRKSSAPSLLSFGSARLCFYSPDCFAFESEGTKEVTLMSAPGRDCEELWVTEHADSVYSVRGYCKTGDSRDPDELVPWSVTLCVGDGHVHEENGRVFVRGDGSKRIFFTVQLRILSAGHDAVPLIQPKSFDAALDLSEKWFREGLRDLDITVRTEKEAAILCRAVTGLLFNLTRAPGRLEGHVSAFPNRGGYPTHFLWDSCFQNLGLELMDLELAKESVELFADTQRADGKYEQFICSTWGRPSFCQPALMGWAAVRLTGLMMNRGTGESELLRFAGKMAVSLDKNNDWWFNNRMTRHGLVFCDDGLETGQDNSPRFDNGRVLAVDMNSYLFSQLDCTSRLAGIAGLEELAKKNADRAEKLGKRIIELLYDDDSKLFYDADPVTAQRRSLVTGSGFLPIWAGVPIDREKARAVVERHLLNEEEFYGRVIFPCVSYTCEEYDPADWWRGPFWPSLGWMMLETVEKISDREIYLQAARKIYELLIKDGELHELFNTDTGEGSGNPDQGWTQGIFIKLSKMLREGVK